jgi:hypothetical protein
VLIRESLKFTEDGTGLENWPVDREMIDVDGRHFLDEHGMADLARKSIEFMPTRRISDGTGAWRRS